MSTLDVTSVLIATMVNWVTRLAYVLFVTFTTFNEVYYITSFACRVCVCHLKDDSDFLCKLVELNNNHTLPPETILVTWDVKSLYTNIPHEGGIKACDYFMRRHNFPNDKRETTIQFINLVLTCNNLTFQGKHYVQQTGTAMGTRMAPSYASLYMGQLEDHFLREAADQPLVWFRYIDDIFFIWTHGEEKLKNFFNLCNSFDPHIKFEQTTSTTSIPFLDVQVINNNGKLSTDLYTKPTDNHQYLNWTSCHPRHTKISIPYSLPLRLRRICSDNHFFEKRARELHNILLERGYKNKLIKECIMKARRTSRQEALINRPISSTDRVPLVVTYKPALPNLHSILKEHHQILLTSSKARAIFKEPPLVAYRRGRNLAQMLTHKRLPSPLATDTTPQLINLHNIQAIHTFPVHLILLVQSAADHFKPTEILKFIPLININSKNNRNSLIPDSGLVGRIFDVNVAIHTGNLHEQLKATLQEKR